MPDHRQEPLSALLAAAGRAHAQFEDELGGTDPDWPGWYADWLMAHGIADLLSGPVDRNRLREQLLALDKEHRAARQPAAWPEYYAAALLQQSP